MMNKARVWAVLPALALGLAAGGAGAQEFALNYGVALTSNYISDGATQSDDKPALQGYVEGSYGLFYGGVWSSTVDFPGDPEFGDDNLEFDLYAGVRPTLGDFSFDLSYYRYLYDSSGDCCGEFVLIAQYPVADFGEVGVEYDYDPVDDTRWGEAGRGADLRRGLGGRRRGRHRLGLRGVGRGRQGRLERRRHPRHRRRRLGRPALPRLRTTTPGTAVLTIYPRLLSRRLTGRRSRRAA